MNNEHMIAEIEQTRHSIISLINMQFDRIIANLEGSEDMENVSAGCEASVYEYALPITVNPE